MGTEGVRVNPCRALILTTDLRGRRGRGEPGVGERDWERRVPRGREWWGRAYNHLPAERGQQLL